MEMKKKGIGRPSTYAKIVSTLIERKYIARIKDGLVSTKIGEEVYNYLSSNFSRFVSEETTRNLELVMDKIEQGELNYKDVLKQLYREIQEIRNIY